MLKAELDRIRERISDPSFLENKGLSNEVGIHVFCYNPADELVVQDYIRRDYPKFCVNLLSGVE